MRLDSTLKKKSSPIYLGPQNLDTIFMYWMNVKLADNFFRFASINLCHDVHGHMYTVPSLNHSSKYHILHTCTLYVYIHDILKYKSNIIKMLTHNIWFLPELSLFRTSGCLGQRIVSLVVKEVKHSPF